MASLTPEARDKVVKHVALLIAPDSTHKFGHMRDKAERLVDLAADLHTRMLDHSASDAVQLLAVALATVGADDHTSPAAAEVAADEVDAHGTTMLLSGIMDDAPPIDVVRTWSKPLIREVDAWASSESLGYEPGTTKLTKPEILQAWEDRTSDDSNTADV